jgi:hypothetical protein
LLDVIEQEQVLVRIQVNGLHNRELGIIDYYVEMLGLVERCVLCGDATCSPQRPLLGRFVHQQIWGREAVRQRERIRKALTVIFHNQDRYW